MAVDLSGISAGDMFELMSDGTSDIIGGSGRRGVLESVCEFVDENVESDCVGVFLYNRRDNSFENVASTLNHEVFDGISEHTEHLGRVLDMGQISVKSSEDISISISGVEGESHIICPIGTHGVILIADSEGRITEFQMQLCGFISHIASDTLDNIRRENGMEDINELSRDATEATSSDYVANLCVEYIENTLDFPFTAIWKHNPVTNVLKPVAQSDKSEELIGDLPVFGPANSIAWDVFHESGTRIVQDTEAERQTEDPTIRSEVITSIGDYGVLATGSLRKSNITEVDKDVATMLSSMLESTTSAASFRGEVELLENTVFRALRHNIQNDLTVLRGNIDMLEAELDDEDHIITAKRTAKEIESVIENARLLRSVIQSQEVRKSVVVDDMVDDALSYVDSTPEDFEMIFDLECDKDIYAHPKFSAAIGHLLQNSVRHASDVGTEVTLRVRCNEEIVILTVSDDGQGIPDHETAVLGEEESGLHHGSGLGLWIIDRIVENSDGTISFYNDDGTTAEIMVDAE